MSPLETPDRRAVDRRTFLTQMPRQLVASLKGLMSEVSPRDLLGFSADPPTHRRDVAMIDVSQCLAWDASPCQACYLRCPLRDEAIILDDGRPVVMASACTGCGDCVEACRLVNDLGAIRLVVSDNLNHTPSPSA